MLRSSFRDYQEVWQVREGQGAGHAHTEPGGSDVIGTLRGVRGRGVGDYTSSNEPD